MGREVGFVLVTNHPARFAEQFVDGLRGPLPRVGHARH